MSLTLARDERDEGMHRHMQVLHLNIFVM